MRESTWKKALWPATMCLASATNAVGAAVAMGMDIQENGKLTNPFPVTSMATSSLYMVSNAWATYMMLTTVSPRQERSFVELEEARRNQEKEISK